MADFFKGLAGGMQTGLQLGQQLRQRRMEDELAQVYAKPETSQGYTAEDGQTMEEYAKSGVYDIVPQYAPAAEGQTQGVFTGYQAVPKVGVDAPGNTPLAPISFNQKQVQDYGGRRVAGQFSPEQLQGLQMREAARVMGSYGDPVRAAQLQADAIRMEREAEERPLRQRALKTQVEVGESQLRGLGRTEARETGFDTAFDAINKTEYKTPAERDAAVLAAVSQFKGPEAAAALQANYSTNERNNILTQGAKFDQTIKQARLKGPAAALQAIDELNDSFKLEIDGFKVTQVNNDGTRVPFLQAKNAEEFALSVDSRIKEGGAFELAKFRQDELTKTAQIGYYNALAKKANSEGGAAANQLSGVQLGFTRDEKTGQPVQVMTALKFNKRTGELESVQVPLDRNVVPPSALDPKKIADQAEALVGTPVDPTNKKGPQHTFLTAQQAVVDQIFNQYLGTGTPAAGLDLSPAAVAKRMLEGQKPAAAPAAAPAPRQTGAAGIDTSRPRTDVNPVTNLPRETPVSAPNLVAAASRGLDAGQARYKAYLEGKIAANQALTPDEAIRAKRFGLQ
jgi:hypothetical protein